MRLYPVTALAVAISSLSAQSDVALAQGDTPQAACIGILDRVNYNYERRASSSQQSALRKANFCSADYDKATSAQRANIEGSYKFFEASASGAAETYQERQKRVCNSTYGDYWYSQADLSEQRVAVTEALDTVAKCIELSKDKKLTLKTTITEDNKQVVFAMKWNDGVPLKINFAGPNPWNSIDCYTNGKKVNRAEDLSTSIKPLEEWAFSCTRPTKQLVIGDDKVNCVEPIAIVISADKISDAINLPRACETDYLISRAKKVDDTVAALKQDLSKLQSDHSTTSSNVQQLKNTTDALTTFMSAERGAVKYTLAHNAVGCPSGWNDLGIIGVIMRDQDYGNNLGGGGPLHAGWTWTHPKLCSR